MAFSFFPLGGYKNGLQLEERSECNKTTALALNIFTLWSGHT
jgi:hypothetical protein